jgi:hypothetical protein
MRFNSLLLVGLLAGLALSPSFSSTVHADELPCDTIIAPENWYDPFSDLETITIEDCADPFGRSEGVESPYMLEINGESVVPNGTAYIADSGTNQYELTGNALLDGASILFFLHDGDDYRYVNTEPSDPTESDFRAFALSYFPAETDIELYVTAMDTGDYPTEGFDEDLFWQFYNAFYEQFVEEPVPLLPGTYTLVIQEYEINLARNGFLERIARLFIPTAYASDYQQYIFTITFTLEVEPEESMDPLLLEYMPILRMHENEDYLPMNVEAFVAGSALWDDRGIFPDELVRPYDAEDPMTIEDLASYDDSEDLYLAFSNPENAKSINIAEGLAKYDELVDEEVAQTTVYARKMEDSYEDSFGEEHEFTVLQYWYFYAMNDWEEKEGLNNHEGDWESVFVFLDADTEEPKYVAFSAHHNDGEEDVFGIVEYDSVRRIWDDNEIEQENSNVVSYVALGSHANYPKAGNYKANIFGDIDQALGSGRSIHSANLENRVEIYEAEPAWLDYEGKWGTDLIRVGWDGPQGPYFIDVSGYLRYHNPLEWAGIDKIEEVVTEEPATWFLFPVTGIELNFGALVPAGTFFSTSPYFESPKGTAPSGTQLLSPFWDIESDLENETFNTEVRLPIDPESLLEAGGSATLHAYWFNPDTEGWEKQESTVDETGNFVVFNTNHFSRYAIGIEAAPEPPVIEEDEIETTSSKSTGTRVGNRDAVPQVKGAQTSAQAAVTSDSETVVYETLIGVLEYILSAYTEKSHLTPSEIQEIMEELRQLLTVLETVQTY